MDAATPRWSPDGKTILFFSHEDPDPSQHGNLFTITPNGRHLVQLTHFHKGFTQATTPDWSPDGKWIVFHRRNYDPSVGTNQLFIMRADGKGMRQLTHLPRGSNPGQPKWGPLG
jgi:Tol biopolymer transport system component